MLTKEKILARLTQLLWLGFLTVILSTIAGASLRVFAAFTEPAAAPAASNQDFAKNILGANNADNAFDSSLVAASSTGSIVERLKYLQDSFSLNFPQQKYQAYDDWNCNGSAGTGNNDVSAAACSATDPEETAEESVWASTTDTALAGALVAGGIVKKDMRTGLYWSDCYSSASNDGTCDTRTNSFNPALSLCTAAEINGGTCDINDRATSSMAITVCQNLSLDANGDGTDETDWYLPSQKELMQAYINGAANNLPRPGNYFWSKTENGSGTINAWSVYLSNGDTISNTKSVNYNARCVRR